MSIRMGTPGRNKRGSTHRNDNKVPATNGGRDVELALIPTSRSSDVV
jgi:hypothetical protein